MGKPTKQQWRLKDLREAGEVTISDWSLDTPQSEYTATAAHYGREAAYGVIHFAQVVHGRPMNALALLLPPASVRDVLLPNLGAVRERLRLLEEAGSLEPVEPLDPGKLVNLGSKYLQKAADRVRVATNDTTTSIDFYKLPVIPRALIEAQPNQEIEINDVVRVTVSSSIFYALLEQMEAVEGYEPEAETNAD